ncbi:MAG TPA: GGDEF domain-containing protein [Acidobacteriota bacterium]|nr:GGDEF domain-containing protein [Acidobacteriota bacterium]
MDFEERIAELERELKRTYRGIETLQEELVRRNEQVEALSRHDGETGVMSAPYFQDRLDTEVLRSQRYGTPLTLLMLELDGLGPLRSRLGEDAEKILLFQTAERMRLNSRRTDLIGRGAQGQMVMALFATSSKGAKFLAQRLRKAVRDEAYALSGSPPLDLTCSIGVASVSAQVRSRRLLVEAAVGCLREAQSKGGDQIRVAGEMPFLRRLLQAFLDFLKDPPRRSTTATR